MDWIKVLNRHTVFEYTDLRDSEFVAWIRIMSLTALMEKMPTREQMLKYTHHKTLDSLQDKLKTHSTTLQDILKKVLKDAQDVNIRREVWKKNKKQYREVNKNVSMDVSMDVSHKEKEIDIDKDNKPPISPKKRGMIYADDFLIFWKAYPKRVGKDAAWRAWKARNGTRPEVADLVTAISKQTQSDQWQKENGQFIPNPATWLNQGRWADEEAAIESPLDKWAREREIKKNGTV